MTNLKEILAGAHLPERTVPLCLRGDLVAEFEELERKLEDTGRRPADSLAGDGSGDIIDRMEALQDQMRASTVTFRLRALPKPKWRALLAAHPPRRGDDGEPLAEDVTIGVNRETFFDAIIRACLVDPEVDDETWDMMAGENGRLTDRQLATLTDAAWDVNRGEISIPFSRAASRVKRTTERE